MAKGQFTEEEARTSMKELGGFSSVLQSSHARKDSPFRNSLVEPVPSSESQKAKSGTTIIAASPPVAEKVDRSTEIERPQPEFPRASQKPKTSGFYATGVSTKLKSEPPVDEQTEVQFADDGLENITLPIEPALRDEVNEVARTLQRRKTQKGKRITANTFMRVAIKLVLEALPLNESERPNNADELFAILKRKVQRKP